MCETTFQNEQNKQQISKTNERKKINKQHTIFIHQNFHCSENCPYLEFFWSALFCIRIYITDQKNYEYGHIFTKCFIKLTIKSVTNCNFKLQSYLESRVTNWLMSQKDKMINLKKSYGWISLVCSKLWKHWDYKNLSHLYLNKNFYLCHISILSS